MLIELACKEDHYLVNSDYIVSIMPTSMAKEDNRRKQMKIMFRDGSVSYTTDSYETVKKLLVATGVGILQRSGE